MSNDTSTDNTVEHDDDIERVIVKQTDNLPEHLCYPEGFIGEFVRYLSETAEYVLPECFLAASLSLLSVITGRKVQDYRGTRTNLFCISIARSGGGKDKARKAVRSILAGTELEGPEKFTAGSAIVTALCKSPSLLVQCDEIGDFLRAACSERAPAHMQNIISSMMTVYTSSDTIWRPTGYADSLNTKAVDQPHLVIHGTTAPERFFDAISGSHISSGFFGRLLVFTSPKMGYVMPVDTFKIKPVPDRIMRFVKRWVDMPCGSGNLSDQFPDPPVLPITDEARQRLNEHFRCIAERRMDEHIIDGTIWSRASEKSSKLAMLHTLSRGSSHIELQDANWAIAVVNFLTRRAIALIKGNVASTDYERKVQRILKIVAESNGLIGLRELGRKTQWLPSKEKNEILNQLKQAGSLFECVSRTKGREAHGYALSVRDIKAHNGWELLTKEMLEEAVKVQRERVKSLAKLS